MTIQLILVVVLLFTSALPKAAAQSVEEKAIKRAVFLETKYFLSGDSVAWKATWLHDFKVTHNYASSSFYTAMTGWDSVERGVIRRMVFGRQGKSIEPKYRNFLIRINGDLASADFDQISGQSIDSSEDVDRGHRILVKQNGKWKIAAVSGYVISSWTSGRDHSEDNLNSAGYNLLSAKRIEDAIDVFKLNVKQHPNSWNCYDSLGEAYAIAGNKDLAIENYEKSISLNPKNEIGKATLTKLKMK